jgi:hypothetical protein
VNDRLLCCIGDGVHNEARNWCGKKIQEWIEAKRSVDEDRYEGGQEAESFFYIVCPEKFGASEDRNLNVNPFL